MASYPTCELTSLAYYSIRELNSIASYSICEFTNMASYPTCELASMASYTNSEFSNMTSGPIYIRWLAISMTSCRLTRKTAFKYLWIDKHDLLSCL